MTNIKRYITASVLLGVLYLSFATDREINGEGMDLPQNPFELDHIVNRAENGFLGKELINYALLEVDPVNIISAIKESFLNDMRAREVILGRINTFIQESSGKAPTIIIIGENHNDPVATRLLNYFLRKATRITYLGMEAFLNDPTNIRSMKDSNFKELERVLAENKNNILDLLDREEDRISVYDSELLEKLIMEQGQQSVLDAFLAGDVVIPHNLNMTDLLYGENKLQGSVLGIDTVRLLALSILITAVNAIDEDGMLTRLETLEICREEKIVAFGFHQPVSLMDVSALSNNRNDYYTWTLDNYYSQVISRYLDQAKDRNQVVMFLSIGAAHAERSHLPLFLPSDCRIMVVDLAGTSKIIEDALDKAKLGTETGWIDLISDAKKQGYISSRLADIYMHYPTPAKAPY